MSCFDKKPMNTNNKMLNIHQKRNPSVNNPSINNPSINNLSINNPRVNNPKQVSPNNGELLLKEQYDLKEFVKKNVQKQPMGDAPEGFAELNALPSSGGLMRTSEAESKKWDPKKMIPNTTKSVRPKNSLASQFGPSQTEMALYLPTARQMLENRSNGPKFLRRAAQIKRMGGDFRPLMIPQSKKDWKGIPNRPRIDETHYQDAIDADKKMFGQLTGF